MPFGPAAPRPQPKQPAPKAGAQQPQGPKQPEQPTKQPAKRQAMSPGQARQSVQEVRRFPASGSGEDGSVGGKRGGAGPLQHDAGFPGPQPKQASSPKQAASPKKAAADAQGMKAVAAQKRAKEAASDAKTATAQAQQAQQEAFTLQRAAQLQQKQATQAIAAKSEAEAKVAQNPNSIVSKQALAQAETVMRTAVLTANVANDKATAANIKANVLTGKAGDAQQYAVDTHMEAKTETTKAQDVGAPVPPVGPGPSGGGSSSGGGGYDSGPAAPPDAPPGGDVGSGQSLDPGSIPSGAEIPKPDAPVKGSQDMPQVKPAEHAVDSSSPALILGGLAAIGLGIWYFSQSSKKEG